jgi:hypothetical protein
MATDTGGRKKARMTTIISLRDMMMLVDPWDCLLAAGSENSKKSWK